MHLSTLLREKRDHILRIAAQHGASNVRVFGSVARGEAGPGSDLDLLVSLAPGRPACCTARWMWAVRRPCTGPSASECWRK